MSQITLAVLLEMKGYQIYSINPGASVFDAIQMMSERSIGAVLVMEHGELVGIMSERDYTRKVILQGRASRDTRWRLLINDTVEPDL